MNLKKFNANDHASLYFAWDGWRLKERSNPAQWALSKRRIGQGASPLSMHGDIAYTFDKFPFCREPQEQTVNPEVQISVWQFASGMAKTEMAVNVSGYCIDQVPCNQIIAYPKDESRDKFSRDVIQRSLVDATPSVRALVQATGTGNTIAYKRYPGGSLYMIGAVSASNFRGPRCGMAYAGEVDGMNDTTEGDPIFLLWKRCEGFEDAIKIVEGSPTIKGHSRIEFWMNQSDVRKWFCPCRKCGELQFLMWKMVDFPKLGKSRFEKAVMLCQSCATAHNDQQRARMILDGAWKPTQAFNGIRGYWLNGLNSLLPPEKGFKSKLHQFAQDAHRAKHSQKPRETIRVWVNTFLNECYQEEQNAKQDFRVLFDRREEFPADGKIPQGVKLITAGWDFQIDRTEGEFIGWGDDEESWGLGNVAIFGDFRMPESYKQLDSTMNRIFEREDRARLPVVASGWDTGYSAAQRALYAFLRPRFTRRFYAMKGASSKWAPAWAKGRREERITLFLIGTNRMKNYIYNRATIATPGPGFMHFAKNEELGYDEEWFKQLLSEDSHTEYAQGVQMTIFEMPTTPGEGQSARNEALDKRVYAQAALYIRGPVNWEAEEKRNIASIPPKEGEQPKKPARQSSGSSFWDWK